MAGSERDKAFGRRVTALRKAAGFESQEALARALGVSVFTISRYERGESKPNIDDLYRLADTLNTTASELLDGVAA